MICNHPDIQHNDFLYDFSQEMIETVRFVEGYTMTDPASLYALCEAVRYIIKHNIQGAIVECGVWRGGSMMAVARTLLSIGTLRDLYLYDTYAGMIKPTELDVNIFGENALQQWNENHHDNLYNPLALATLDEVQFSLQKTGYPLKNCHLIKGPVEKTIPRHTPETISILRLDTDYYESTRHELIHLFPKLTVGGVLIIDDYGFFHGARKATDEYFDINHTKILFNRVNASVRIAVKLSG